MSFENEFFGIFYGFSGTTVKPALSEVTMKIETSPLFAEGNAFMNMYNKLDSIEKKQTYHQMHIEEYLYQQKTYQKTKKGA